MKELLIKNGYLLSPINGYHKIKKDVLIKDGRFDEIADEITKEGIEWIDATGLLVTPGLIDIHTHCFPRTSLGLEPDELGIKRGATTILDAGSSGANNYELFKSVIDQAKTKVFTLLNVSSLGLEVAHELDDMGKINEEAISECLKKHRDNIVGFKARASASVVGSMGLAPIVEAARLAQKFQLPLTVHVGNYPPALSEVLTLLHQGDIVTHAFHGKKGGILNETGEIIPEAVAARERGVKFDIGHGVASFAFDVYKKARAENFDCDLISTDLHIENYEGPVYNLAAVLSKAINCGETLGEAIHKATYAAAQAYQLKELGEIKVGYIGDCSLMEFIECDEVVVDAMHEHLQLTKKLTLNRTIYSRGDESEIYQHNHVTK